MIAVLALTGGCGKQSSDTNETKSGDDSQQTDGASVADMDKAGDEVMASSTKAEARQWLKQPKHVFFKANPKTVAQFVDDFYNAGAQQVVIGEIEEEEGVQYGEALLVVLPKDSAARAKLFTIGTRAETQFDEDPVTDKGQKYLYYSLD